MNIALISQGFPRHEEYGDPIASMSENTAIEIAASSFGGNFGEAQR